MSHNRSVFILTGGGLLTLAILGITAREFQLGPLAARLAEWSPLVAYGTFGAAAMLGALLLVFAPSSRRVERRVRLDRPDAANPVMARPSASAAPPTTRGMSTSAAARTGPKRTDSVHNQKLPDPPPPASQAGSKTATRAIRDSPTTKAGQPATTRTHEAAWVHPNDIAGEPATPAGADAAVTKPAGPTASPKRRVPSPAATAQPGTPNGARRPPSAADGAPPAVAAEDPVALRARLEELDRQANHAKVRYGLGQLSGNGYRQVLAKLDEARAHIEEALLGDLEV